MPHSSLHARWTRPGLIVLLYALLLFVIGFRGAPSERVRYDVGAHHLPVILKFAREWPTPELSNYKVASTPGYHLALSVVARWISSNENILRCAGAIFTLAMAWTIACAVSRVALILPFLVSLYVVTSGVYLLPENAAWWLVIAILGCCALHPVNRGYFVWIAIAFALLVLMRQTHAWVGLPVVVATLWGESGWSLRRRAAWLGLSFLPAAVVLGYFVWLWGGLTPPPFQPGAPPSVENQNIITYGHLTLVPIGMTLGLIGLFGVFFIPWFGGRTIPWRWIGLGALIALILSAIPESAPVFPFRRSGVWQIFERLPCVASRSVGFVAIATLGGAMLGWIVPSLRPRDRAVFGAALLGFMIAHLPNPMVWQRYYEPFVLLWLALAAHRAVASTEASVPAWRYAPLILLTLALSGVTLVSLHVFG